MLLSGDRGVIGMGFGREGAEDSQEVGRFVRVGFFRITEALKLTPLQ